MQGSPDEVLRCIDAIEAEMRRIGLWQQTPLPAAATAPQQAFGADVMAFQQWLQFVFIPRVRAAVATDTLPTSSSVSAKAVREFDGNDTTDRLVDLLCAFDALFE
jgi:uncharacterized protein YqcC (DUF446 family)